MTEESSSSLNVFFSSKEKLKEIQPVRQNIVHPFSIAPDICICDYYLYFIDYQGGKIKRATLEDV